MKRKNIIILCLLGCLSISFDIPAKNPAVDHSSDPSWAPDAKKYDIDPAIECAIRDFAIKARQNELCIKGVLIFDGKKDMRGNEMFRLELAYNPFQFHNAKEMDGYTMIANCPIFIKKTPEAKKYLKKVEGLPYYTYWDLRGYPLSFGKRDRFSPLHEVFNFVMEEGEVRPFTIEKSKPRLSELLLAPKVLKLPNAEIITP